MKSILDWLRESLTGTAASPTPPWSFPPLPERDDMRPAPGFEPLSEWDDTRPAPPFEPLDDGDRQAVPDIPGPVQHYIVHPIRPAQQIDALLNPTTPGSLWRAVAGHDAAKRHLGQIAAVALRRNDHCCSQGIILVGPNSTDRAALARIFASEVLILPFVQLDGASLAGRNVPLARLLLAISKTLDQSNENWLARGGVDRDGLGMTLVEIDNKLYHPPPLVLFIDEAEKLPKSVLNAMSKADRVIVTELGHTVRSERICWILGVTDRRMLADAFASNFDVVSLGSRR